jgi:hypothetical protein
MKTTLALLAVGAAATALAAAAAPELAGHERANEVCGTKLAEGSSCDTPDRGVP